MEILELLEKIINDIPNIVNAIGIIGFIPTLAVLVVLMIVPVFKSIYSTNIEKVFMKPIEREINTAIGLLVLFVGCVLKNLIFSLDIKIYAFGVILGPFVVLVFLYYKFRTFQIKKVLDNSENAENIKRLDKYYKNKKQIMFFASIFSFVSCLLILFNNSTSDNPELNKLFLHFSKINCAIIIGLIEIIIVCIYMPELIKTPSNLYIYYNNKKTYIYKRIDEENILCGNNSDINDSDRHMIISCEYLRGKKISKEIYDIYIDDLSSEEKKELKKEINRKFLEKLKEKFR